MRLSSVVVSAVLASTCCLSTAPAGAQEPPASNAASGEAAVTELPSIEVEASTAKRNRKKVQLRRSSPPAASAAAPAASEPATAAPQTVVEGEKVTRTIKETTTSIGVVTGQDIKERQVQDLQEAIQQTPNAVVSEAARGASGIVIRGLNSEGYTGTQHISAVPTVSVVIDGASQNQDAIRRGARALWDVEQVEVLRGPQSTLQARNSLAGSVIVKTNDPTYDLSALVEGTAGTNGLKAGGFVLNAPIVAGQSAFRLSGYKEEGERGIRYTDPRNNSMDDDRLENLRGKLLIEPDALPGFSALFTASRIEDRPAINAVTGPNFLKREFDATSSSVDFREGTSSNYISDVSYQFMPGLTARSVSAFAQTQTEIATPIGAQLIRNGDNYGADDFTQDLRLEIDSRGNGLSGVVGLFYGSFNRQAFTNSDLDLSQTPFRLPVIIPFQDSRNRGDTESLAVYNDLRYRLDRFVFIGGGRLLRDDVASRHVGRVLDTVRSRPGNIIYNDIDEEGSVAFTEWLPKAGLTFDLTPDQTIGVSYSEGYRAGFTQLTPRGVVNTIDPEFLKAYEISYRSQWLNRTFDLNANVFYYDYANQQLAKVTPGNFNLIEIANAGSSTAYGSELEAKWRPLPGLQVFTAVGWLQTEFKDFITTDNDPTGDYSGNEFPEAPAYTLSGGVMYRSPTGWFAGANARHVAGYYSSGNLANQPAAFLDAYTVVDARVGWEWEHYTLTVFGKNLLGEEYLTSLDLNRAGTPLEATIGDERLVGVTLTGRF